MYVRKNNEGIKYISRIKNIILRIWDNVTFIIRVWQLEAGEEYARTSGNRMERIMA